MNATARRLRGQQQLLFRGRAHQALLPLLPAVQSGGARVRASAAAGATPEGARRLTAHSSSPRGVDQAASQLCRRNKSGGKMGGCVSAAPDNENLSAASTNDATDEEGESGVHSRANRLAASTYINYNEGSPRGLRDTRRRGSSVSLRRSVFGGGSSHGGSSSRPGALCRTAKRHMIDITTLLSISNSG